MLSAVQMETLGADEVLTTGSSRPRAVSQRRAKAAWWPWRAVMMNTSWLACELAEDGERVVLRGREGGEWPPDGVAHVVVAGLA